MFGCPAYFTNGNLFAGVHQSSLMVRLPENGAPRSWRWAAGPSSPCRAAR